MHDFLSYLFYLLQRGLNLALPAVVLAAVVLGTVWLIYRKNDRPFPWKKAFLILVLIGWLVLTLFVTLLRGEGNGFREWNFHLFLAWKEAWSQFTLKVWLNVLLNIALFMPLGFLLPLLAQKFKNGLVMLITGFGSSLLIELTQLALGRGMFDVDDLFTNTLGAMLGWALIMVLITAVKRPNNWGKRACAYLALPLTFILALALIFGGYALKPYGNLSENYVVKADLANIQWQIAFEPDDISAEAYVYKVGRLDKTAAEAFAADLIPQGEELIYGTLVCSLKEEDGVTYLQRIANSMVVLEPYQEEAIISQAQAIEKLQSGESFYGDLMQYYEIEEAEILSCSLAWLSDTKGFYQPVYRFELKQDGGNTTIDYVAALK